MGCLFQFDSARKDGIFSFLCRHDGFVAKTCRFCLLFCAAEGRKIKKTRSQLPQSRFRSTAPLSRGALGKEGQLLRACPKKQKPPTPCQKHSIEGGLFSKSRFHSGLSLKADNGGHPRCDTQLPAACCPGALHAAVCKQASSQRPVLSAQTMQRYSARINAFILLPLYYSGAVQGSQGGTKNDSECPPRCFGHPQRNNYSEFRDIGTPAGVPISHFHGKGAERSGAQSKRWCFTRDTGLLPAALLPALPALPWAVLRPAGDRGYPAFAT